MGFEVFFDGDCPLCRREIRLIRYVDRKNRIVFTDIASDAFVAETIGLSYEELMDFIHGREVDGSLVRGVEVFRRICEELGLPIVASISRWSIFSRLLDAGYKVFARNRLRLTGRCQTESCSTTLVGEECATSTESLLGE